MERRHQIGHGGLRFGALIGQPRKARARLWHWLLIASPLRKIRWKVLGGEWSDPARPWGVSRQIVSHAEARHVSTTYLTSTRVIFELRVAPVIEPVGIPPAALRTRATRATLAFHEEMQLVFPGEWKTLGLYVARPLKSDEPAGWDVGDPWPAGAYASEHAWAAAEDTGMSDDRNPSAYETDAARLSPFLAKVTAYIKANWRRLGVNEHIYNRLAWTGPKTAHVYTGSDAHETHTHTQFADHAGRRPPWL